MAVSFGETAKLFLDVVEYGSFSRASKELYLAKSTIKKQMDSLEAEIGVPLFERGATGVRLTPAGEVFREESRAIIQRIDALRDKCSRAMREASSRVIRVAHYSDFIFPFIQYCCDLYVKAYPDDRVVPVITPFDNAYEGIRSGMFDVAFCPKTGPRESVGILSQMTFLTPMCGLVSLSSELAQKSVLTRADLAGTRVATHRNWYQQDQVEIWSKRRDPAFDVAPMRGGTDDIQHVCSTGGVYLYPESDAFVLPYVKLPLDDELILTGGIAFRTDPLPATLDFARVVDEYVSARRDPKTLLLVHDFSERGV